MTLFDFAKKNVMRDPRSYIFYFLNSMFSVLVFFLFSVLSFHPSMQIIDENSTMGIILALGEVLSVLFSLLFIAFSVSGFLKTRSKQFGIITILGASKKQLNRLVFSENILVGLSSLVAGVGLGLIFSKLFLDIASRVIGNVDFYFYFPVKALVLTLAVLGSVFALIAWLTPKFVRKEKILSLITSEKKAEKKQRLLPATLCFIILATAAVYSLLSKSTLATSLVNSHLALLMLLLSIVLGIYLLISYGFIVWEKIAIKSGAYYNGVNIISMSDAASKRKSVSVGMTLTTILYTIAFLTLTVLLANSGNVKQETDSILPYAVEYINWEESASASEHISTIQEHLSPLEGYRDAVFKIYKTEQENSRIRFMNESDYNALMVYLNRSGITLNAGDVYTVEGDAGKTAATALPDSVGQALSALGYDGSFVGGTDETILLSGLCPYVAVLSDEDWTLISDKLKDQTVYVYNYDVMSEPQQALDKIRTALKSDVDARNVSLAVYYNYYHTTQLQTDLTLYIGAILCLSFLTAVLSFIFSRLYAQLDKDAARLLGIVKLGLSKKELKRVLAKNVQLLLIIPFAVAAVIMWIGVLLINKSMIVSIIPGSILFTLSIVLVQAAFSVIMQKSYNKKMFEKIYQS